MLSRGLLLTRSLFVYLYNICNCISKVHLSLSFYAASSDECVLGCVIICALNLLCGVDGACDALDLRCIAAATHSDVH